MNLINTLPNVTQKYPLSFQDIENALFFNKNPEFTVYPFPQKSLKKTSITFSVPFLSKTDSSLKSIFSNLKKINGNELSVEEKNEVLLVFVPFITMSFFDVLKIWQDYVMDNIKEFCNTEVSIINWKTLQTTGDASIFNKELTFFQKLWISINVQKDRDFWLKTATDIRESLLPWLNNELWNTVEKNKVNKRENVAYEEQKKAMVEGEIKNLDKTEDSKQKVYEDEDLDIIK